MPRKSLAALTTLRIDGRPSRLSPPAGLAADAKRIFQGIVTACEARQFQASDLPLLAQYSQAIALAERAVKELNRQPVIGTRASPWLSISEKAWRATVALAPKLRLTPSSRYDSRAAQRRGSGGPASHYETMEPDDD